MIDVKPIQGLIKDNLPAILTATACVGTVTTALLTAKGTTLAIEKVADYAEANLRDPSDLSWKEKFGVAYSAYVPAAIAGVSTLVAIVAANRIQYARGAALAIAYAGSEKAFARYRRALEDVGGPKAVEEVKARVAETAVQEAPRPDSQRLVIGSGDVLCYDMFSGRYFNSDIESIRRVENNINYQLNTEGYASLNEFYAGLGVPPISAGEMVGWREANSLSVDFGSQLDPSGRPVLTIDFLVAPKENYYKFS